MNEKTFYLWRQVEKNSDLTSANILIQAEKKYRFLILPSPCPGCAPAAD